MGWDIQTDADANGGKVLNAGKATANGHLTRYDEMKTTPGVTGDYAGYDGGGRLQANDPFDDLDVLNKQFFDANAGDTPTFAAGVKDGVAPFTGASPSAGSDTRVLTPTNDTIYIFYTESLSIKYVKSTDAGATWSSPATVDSPNTYSNFLAFAEDASNLTIIATDSSNMYAITSTDGGSTWNTRVDTGVDDTTNVGSAYNVPGTSTYWVVGETSIGDVVRGAVSTDSGATWTTNIIVDLTNETTQAMDIVAYDANTAFFYLGSSTTDEIYKTTDGGSNWTAQSAPVQSITSNDDHVMMTDGSATVVLLQTLDNSNLFMTYTEDSGSTWASEAFANRGARQYAVVLLGRRREATNDSVEAGVFYISAARGTDGSAGQGVQDILVFNINSLSPTWMGNTPGDAVNGLARKPDGRLAATTVGARYFESRLTKVV